LFKGIQSEKINSLLNEINFELHKFTRGEIIFTPDSYSAKIGFIYDGECEICCLKPEGKTILNTIKPGDSFGILAALGQKEFPTEIYAKKNTSVLFLSSEDLITLIKSSSAVALNVIEFLAGRVNFLNKKINTVTKTTVEKKLAAYLITRCKNECSTTFHFNFKKCGESINAGRASVYRAIENLKTKGYISAEKKNITIRNISTLEEFVK